MITFDPAYATVAAKSAVTLIDYERERLVSLTLSGTATP